MGTVQTDPRFYALYLELAADYDLPLRMVGHAGERSAGLRLSRPGGGTGASPSPTISLADLGSCRPAR